MALSEQQSSESIYIWCIYILEIADNDSGSVSINFYRIYELFRDEVEVDDNHRR